MFTRILAGLAGMALVTSLRAAEPIRPPDLNATQVTLPYSELKALWQSAHREASAKRKPPVEAALLSARYQLSLKGDIAAGVVDYEVENFTDEWTTIPLLGVQTPVDEIEPADAQLIIREGRYAVVTNRPGKQKLRLKFAVKLIAGTDRSHFALVASPAAINTLSVSGVPDKQTLRILDATQLSADKDRINFRLPAAERIELRSRFPTPPKSRRSSRSRDKSPLSSRKPSSSCTGSTGSCESRSRTRSRRSRATSSRRLARRPMPPRAPSRSTKSSAKT